METNYETYYPDETINGILTERVCLLGVIGRLSRSNNMDVLSLYQNNDRTYRVYVKTPELLPQVLAGATVVMTVKETKESTSDTFTKSTADASQAIITDPTGGEVEFYIVPADTASLDIRQYVFDIKVTLSNSKAYTVIEGIINLKEGVA